MLGLPIGMILLTCWPQGSQSRLEVLRARESRRGSEVARVPTVPLLLRVCMSSTQEEPCGKSLDLGFRLQVWPSTPRLATGSERSCLVRDPETTGGLGAHRTVRLGGRPRAQTMLHCPLLGAV